MWFRHPPIWPEPGAEEPLRPLRWPRAAASRRLRVRGVPRMRMVTEGCLYVGGQPDESAYWLLRSRKLKTIINLRAEARPRGWNPERGMHHLPVPRRGAPTFEQAEELLRILGDAQAWPALVHCRAGDGRSATMAALVRYAFDGWDLEECLREAARHRRFRLLVWLGIRPRLEGAQEQFLRQWARMNGPGSRRPLRRPREGIRFCGEVMHREEILRLWIALPEEVRCVPVRLSEKTSAEWNGVSWAGLYNYEKGEIEIASNHWRPSVFYHEYAHALWHDGMTGDQRRDWEGFWLRNLDRMPRDYGRKNPQEGFCECFVVTHLPETPRGYRPLETPVRRRVMGYFLSEERR